MDLKKRVPFGMTGLMVSRIGLASGYGVPAAAIEKAFHEYGINYLYISPILNLSNMVKAIGNLAPGHRDELIIVLARPFFGGFGGRRLEKQAVPAQDPHGDGPPLSARLSCLRGQSQAAPRTPLESPWAGGRIGVST